jgi:hypothetical protein
MHASRMFFHMDKRLHDKSTSEQDKANQFARVNEAWDKLNACRSHFQELTHFRQKLEARPKRDIKTHQQLDC